MKHQAFKNIIAHKMILKLSDNFTTDKENFLSPV
jgi:hypothetical protein